MRFGFLRGRGNFILQQRAKAGSGCGFPREAFRVPATRSGILLIMKKLVAQFMKFGVVGFIAFFIDYGLLAFCTEALHINYLVSATIGFSVSVVFNYFASMRYVFSHKEGMSKRREFIIFVVLSVIGLIINNALMWTGVECLHVHYLIVKVFATAVVMVWNFATRKIFLDAEGAASNDLADWR